MRFLKFACAAVTALGLGVVVRAATVYVAPTATGAADGSDADNAMTLADGVTASQAGDTIQLADGVYAVAETVSINNRILSGNVTDCSRVTLNAAAGVRILSVANAASVVRGLTLVGAGTVSGNGGAIAIDEGRIENCRIESFAASDNGGGVYCAKDAAVVSQCVISNCTASIGGAVCGNFRGTVADCALYDCKASSYGSGGAWLGTVLRTRIEKMRKSGEGSALWRTTSAHNCLFIANDCNSGAAYCTTCYNCTFVDSTGGTGGVWGVPAYNCLFYGGRSDVHNSTTLYNCLTETTTLNGCVSGDPLLTEDYRLGKFSPCFNAGNSDYVLPAAGGIDFEGNPRIQSGKVSIGCFERAAYPGEIAVSVAIPVQTVSLGDEASFSAFVSVAAVGETLTFVWTFGDGSGETVTHTVASVPETIEQRHRYDTIGFHDVSVEVVTADSRSVFASAVPNAALVMFPEARDLYLSPDGNDDADGYTPATAKRLPERVLVAARSGSTVHLAPGTTVFSSCVTVTNAITITGDRVSREASLIGTGGEQTFRPLYINNALARVENLSFIGITNNQDGAAIYLSAGTVSNCVFDSCRSTKGAGAVKMQSSSAAKVTGCLVTRNQSKDWNAALSSENNTSPQITDCVITDNFGSSCAGGVARGTVYRCVISGNSTSSEGGGVWRSLAYDCLIVNNRATFGGASYLTPLYNCTVVGNYSVSATGSGGLFAGGAPCSAYNCIFKDNTNAAQVVRTGDGASARFFNCALVGESREVDYTLDDDCDFRDPVFGKGWTLKASSPYAVSESANALTATFFPNAASRALDLAGNSRRYEKGATSGKIALGCYQATGATPLVLVVR